MSRLPPARDRLVRIELLRARATVERQGVVHGLRQVGHDLTPGGIFESVFPRAKRRSPSDLLNRALVLSRRYPMVLSLGSALLSAAGRRRLRWLRLAAGAVLAWKVSHNLRK